MFLAKEMQELTDSGLWDAISVAFHQPEMIST